MLRFLNATGVVWELPFEIPFIQWLQSLGGEGSFLFYVMNFVSMFGEEMLLIGLLGLVYWGLDKNKGEKLGFMLLSATLLNPMIKNIFCRIRPFDAHPYNAGTGEGVQNLRDVDGFSFPSGHSSGSATLFLGIATAFGKKQNGVADSRTAAENENNGSGRRHWLWTICIVIPLSVAISRMYLGAHYPTDVVCGLLLGAAVVFGVEALWKAVPNKLLIYAGALIVGLIGMFYCTTDDYFTAFGLLVGFVCGVLFEKKYVNFQNTKIWWRIALRLVVGGALYLGLNLGLKALVGCFGDKVLVDGELEYWFDDGNHQTFSHAFRCVRYTLIAFVLMGVYPTLFAQTEKLWDKLGLVKSDEQQAR